MSFVSNDGTLQRRRSSLPQLATVLSQIALKERRMSKIFSYRPPLRHFSLRQKIYALLDPLYEHPSKQSYITSWAIQIFLTLVNIAAVIGFLIESLPEYYANSANNPTNTSDLDNIETVCTVIFTVDFIVRIFCCDSVKDFSREVYNWIDLLSILPFYIRLMLQSDDGLLPFFRLLRTLRILKTTMYSSHLTLFLLALRQSLNALQLLVFLLTLGVVIFSSLMFLLECQDVQYFDYDRLMWIRTDSGTYSPFQSIPHTCWWGLVTLATLGYGGDDVPISLGGKLVAAVAMYCACFVVAFPIVEITHNFNLVIENYQGEKKALDLLSPNNVLQREGSNTNQDPDDIPSGTIVCNLKLNNRIIPITYHGKVAKVPQFRYDPLCMPVDTDGNGGGIDLRINPTIQQYILCIRIMLDSEATRSCVAAAVSATRVFRNAGSPINCFAHTPARAVVRIPHLPPQYMLQTSEFSSPSNEVGVVIKGTSEEDLQRLRLLLCILPVHVFLYLKPKSSAPEAVVTCFLPQPLRMEEPQTPLQVHATERKRLSTHALSHHRVLTYNNHTS